MKPDINANIASLKEEIRPYGATIVLITKKRTIDEMQTAYDAGLKIFGENRVQEFLPKVTELPDDVEWHYVGHLQRNKAADIVAHAELIHSGDRVRLLNTLNKEAEKAGTVQKVLLQLHIAEESTKHGFDIEELEEWLDNGGHLELEHLKFCGVMGMATFTDDTEHVRKEFAALKTYFDRISNRYFQHDDQFREISMGMSGDYMIALEEGSTMIRVGQKVFGPRPE